MEDSIIAEVIARGDASVGKGGAGDDLGLAGPPAGSGGAGGDQFAGRNRSVPGGERPGATGLRQ